MPGWCAIVFYREFGETISLAERILERIIKMTNLISKPPMTPDIKRGVIIWIVKAVIGLIFFAALLLLSAGRWDWLWAWVFVGLFALASAVHVWLLLPVNPALLATRSSGLREKGAKTWDKWITGIATGLLPIAAWVVAGLDARWGWSFVPLGWHLLGVVIFAVGWGFVLWATVTNAFFSTTVHLHDGQTVCSSGPYRWVRHPGYVGGILYQFGSALLLGSWWALIPLILSMFLYMLRIALEERLLRAGLAGYKEYTKQTRYRLLPGVW
jgi:protein-S-isoprenylcysteine O-methyltransferase Ste14